MDNEILLKLYGLYHKELYLYLYSLCGDRHLAEDLLHESMALYGGAKSFL